MTASLEDQALRLRTRISQLQERLDDVNQRLHAKKVRETGLVGKVARSDRVPAGITIDDVTFKTWAPTEPQSLSGFRVGRSDVYTTIHVTSAGFEIHDP